MNQRESFSLKSHPEVYRPNEDSWFLAETIRDVILKEKLFLTFNENFSICEVGFGSGYISIFLAKYIPNLRIFGTDISPYAAILGFENMKKWIPNKKFNLYCTNLMDCFDSSKFKPDIIFFNPPYVRTSFDEVRLNNLQLQRSWAGGPEGITIIQEFLKKLESFHFQVAFFVSSSLNSNEQFLENSMSKLVVSEYSKKKVADEHLLCYVVNPIPNNKLD